LTRMVADYAGCLESWGYFDMACDKSYCVTLESHGLFVTLALFPKPIISGGAPDVHTMSNDFSNRIPGSWSMPHLKLCSPCLESSIVGEALGNHMRRRKHLSTRITDVSSAFTFVVAK